MAALEELASGERSLCLVEDQMEEMEEGGEMYI